MSRSSWRPNYEWICHTYQESNSPGLAVCSKCGFPAVASGKEIVAVAVPPVDGLSQVQDRGHKPSIFRFGEITSLPLWKRGLAVFLWMAQLICVIAVWISLSWSVIASGIAIFAVAEALYRLLVQPSSKAAHEEHIAA